MNPEIVVFDLGKVLLDFDFSRAATRLSESSKASFEDLNALINQSPHLHAYEKGAMTTEAFIGQIIMESGFDGTVGDFEEAFSDIFTERPNMIALNRRLRAGGIKTYIFSNTNDMAIRFIRNRYAFFAEFDDYTFSYVSGAMKPEPKIYEDVESMVGEKGEKLLFIDDRLENIEAARARGWFGIHHHDEMATIEEVMKLLQL